MQNTQVLQQKLENWCASSIRAFTGEPSTLFRGHHLFVNNSSVQLRAPHLYLNHEAKDLNELRGVSDGIALRLRKSNSELHDSLGPENPIENLIFELLEQLRCESLAPKDMPGMRSNLERTFLFWAHKAGSSGLVENSTGLLVYTISLMAWSRMLRFPIPEVIEQTIESTRWNLSKTCGAPLRAMTKLAHSQQKFAVHALDVAKTICSQIDFENNQNSNSTTNSQEVRLLSERKLLDLLWLEDRGSVEKGNLANSISPQLSFSNHHFMYRVYDRSYDKELTVSKSIRAAQLKQLRARLDKCVEQQSINIHRVSRHLSHQLTCPSLSSWRFGEEEGYIDSARLTRLISSLNERKLFRKLEHKPASDSIISIVIDNSGSMTNHNSEIATLVDLLAKIFHFAGIKSEILGFTTTHWNGGEPAKNWKLNGKPVNPGRLTSVCHIIYKDADTTWRRARPAMAGLLKSDNFREGVDGEALEWALNRIERRRESKKIIMMISDGSPMDSSSNAANGDEYLDQHLVQVAASIEQRSDIKLCAVGVGLDLSAYFSSNLSIDIEEPLQTKDYFKISELLHRAK